jgi:hypothetical protein
VDQGTKSCTFYSANRLAASITLLALDFERSLRGKASGWNPTLVPDGGNDGVRVAVREKGFGDCCSSTKRLLTACRSTRKRKTRLNLRFVSRERRVWRQSPASVNGDGGHRHGSWCAAFRIANAGLARPEMGAECLRLDGVSNPRNLMRPRPQDYPRQRPPAPREQYMGKQPPI